MNSAYSVKDVDVSTLGRDIRAWISSLPMSYGWLIAYADDGLAWGSLKNGILKLSCDIYPDISPPLKASTLKELRVFNEEREVHIWKSGHDFNACLLEDAIPDDSEDFVVEDYILIGNSIEDVKDGFTLVADRSRGLRHAVPLEINYAGEKRDNSVKMSLIVKHYVNYDEDGQAYVDASRMCGIKLNGKEARP